MESFGLKELAIMESYIPHLFGRIVLWLIAEIFLNLIGLDDLADCGEWVFERRIDILHRSHQNVITLLWIA